MILYRLREKKAKMDTRSIGIFDSGIGGLTVVKEILRQLPGENIIYLGDTARVPYGTRGKTVIKKFSLELADFLLKRKVKFLVVACNTISSTCLDAIKSSSPVPVIGVIDGAVYDAVNSTKTNIVGVIGTQATISSGVYEKEIKKINPKIKIITQACPLFVPLAEEGKTSDKATYLIASEYLKKFKNTKIDTLILGCTHYPVLKEVIQKIVGKKVKLIDSAKPTIQALKDILQKDNLLNNSKKGKHEFFVTDALKRVSLVAKGFLGTVLNGKLKEVNL